MIERPPASGIELRDAVHAELERLTLRAQRNDFWRIALTHAILLILVGFAIYLFVWNLSASLPWLLDRGSKDGGGLQDWLALVPIVLGGVMIATSFWRENEVRQAEDQNFLSKLEATRLLSGEQ